jgi:hypothetical protein
MIGVLFSMNYSKIALGTIIGIVLLSYYSLSHGVMAQDETHFLTAFFPYEVSASEVSEYSICYANSPLCSMFISLYETTSTGKGVENVQQNNVLGDNDADSMGDSGIIEQCNPSSCVEITQSNKQICHTPSTCIQIRQRAEQTDNNLGDITFGNNSLSITFKNGTTMTPKKGSSIIFDNP